LIRARKIALQGEQVLFMLRARAPPYEPTFVAVESTRSFVRGRFVEHGPIEHFCTSITAMLAYEGKSFEELRLEDDQIRKRF
jgi:hypothetical protein